MAAKVADAGVENVVEGVFTEEEIADDAHAPSVLVVHPQTTQVGYRVDCLLHLCHLTNEVLKRHPSKVAYSCNYVLVLLDKGDDSFAVVLGNVLCFVFKTFIVVVLTFCLRLRGILVF